MTRLPGALRRSIEDRLRLRSQRTGEDLQLLRKELVAERILARIFPQEEDAVVVKGGYGMEIRMPGLARTTKDLDLVMRTSPAEGAAIKQVLEGWLGRDGDDHFRFAVGAPERLSIEETSRDGWRFPVESSLDGRIFEPVFVDVSVGDPLVFQADILPRESWLAFDGIAPLRIPVLPIEQHFAEKIHAITRMYRGAFSSRVKDLVDLALLLERSHPDPRRTRQAVEAIFGQRGTHEIPRNLPEPPPSWAVPYAAIATRVNLQAKNVAEAMRALRLFWKETWEEA